ncbi:MAG: hypothetical protein ACD_16C00100G0073 [uncultured bacterium]|nr:MAG: hypothetical protein ACD_16C00100G0073 [uncultured bacterium]
MGNKYKTDITWRSVRHLFYVFLILTTAMSVFSNGLEATCGAKHSTQCPCAQALSSQQTTKMEPSGSKRCNCAKCDCASAMQKSSKY